MLSDDFLRCCAVGAVGVALHLVFERGGNDLLRAVGKLTASLAFVSAALVVRAFDTTSGWDCFCLLFLFWFVFCLFVLFLLGFCCVCVLCCFCFCFLFL